MHRPTNLIQKKQPYLHRAFALCWPVILFSFSINNFIKQCTLLRKLLLLGTSWFLFGFLFSISCEVPAPLKIDLTAPTIQVPLVPLKTHGVDVYCKCLFIHWITSTTAWKIWNASFYILYRVTIIDKAWWYDCCIYFLHWWNCQLQILKTEVLLLTSLVTVFIHQAGWCTVELHHLVPYVPLLFHGYQSWPTLNQVLSKERLPQISSWRL